MNGTNLHDTGVRQMGRAEREEGVWGRGQGEGEEEEEEEEEVEEVWLLKKRGGEGGNKHRVNASQGSGCGAVDVGRDSAEASAKGHNCKQRHIWQKAQSGQSEKLLFGVWAAWKE